MDEMFRGYYGGPQNSRCFSQDIYRIFKVGGTRVVRAVPVPGSNHSSFRVHMNDFNPSAVARCIGKVVGEPTKTEGFRQDVITYLPYVKVVNDRVFNAPFRDIILNEKIFLFP